jgi:hypothetical protein
MRIRSENVRVTNGHFRTYKLSSETSEHSNNPKGYDNSGVYYMNNARPESPKTDICEVFSEIVCAVFFFFFFFFLTFLVICNHVTISGPYVRNKG